MEEINDLVGINNLKIYQNSNWFKFSLESVLLPYFVTINLKCKKIIDLCCGNAPISMILSTRTKAEIIGVDVQKEVCTLAQKSVKLNALDNQIKIVNENIKNLTKIFSPDSFDLVTINPPYFKNDIFSCKNLDIHKALARHEIDICLEDIFKISFYLLKTGGYFAMVHRTERFFEIIELLKKYHLTPKRIQFVYSDINSESNIFMIECAKNGKDSVKFLKPLYIYDRNGNYEKEIEKLLYQRKDD